MYRRKLLVGCLLSVTLSGCLDAPTATGDETDIEDHELQEAYVIHLEPENGIEDGADVCRFTELPEAAQRELEQAIEEEEYRIEETPALMKRGCHNGYVEYDTEHYWLRITIKSG